MSDFKLDDIVVNDEEKNKNKKSKLPIVLVIVSVVILAVIIYILYGIINTQKEISNLSKTEQALIESDILSKDESLVLEGDSLGEMASDSEADTMDSGIALQDSSLEDSSVISNKLETKKHEEKDSVKNVVSNEKQITHKYYILVNSFRGFYYAKKQVNLLKSYGYNAFYKQINIKKGENKGKWYKVYAGPFDNFSDAKKASNYIKRKQNQKNIFIIKKRV